MSDQSPPSGKKAQFSNLSAGNQLVVFSGLLFIISLMFAWTQNKYGLILTTMGYGYIDFYISRSGWPNLIPVSLLAAVGCILLCIPFLKPVDMNKKKKYLMFVSIQIVLSVLGLLAILILWFIQLPTFNGRFMFGAWLGVISMVGLIYGACRTRSELF